MLPGKAGDPGRTGADNRLLVNGCVWVLCSGAHRRDLAERYGKWKSVHRRFSRWCHAGIWQRVVQALAADRNNQHLMIDCTIVRAHQQAAIGKGGHAIRRSGVAEVVRRPSSAAPMIRLRGGAGPKVREGATCSSTRSAGRGASS